MNLYHHQTKRFLYENDRSMQYLLEDSYRTTTYHFVVDDPPPLRVHPDHRIIVKTTDQIHLPLSTYLLHRLEHNVAKSSLRNLVIHHELHGYLFKQDSVSPSKKNLLWEQRRAPFCLFATETMQRHFHYAKNVVVDDEPTATMYQVFLDLSHHRQKW